MEKTSCIILNFNDAESTTCLICKIRDYGSINYIVVVDNASTDNSIEVLKPYVSKKVFLIRADKNGGYGFGNNLGIRFSHEQLKSKYILIANPDVLFEETVVTQLINSIALNKKYAVAAPIPLTPNRKPQEIIAWKTPSISQEILESSVTYNRIFGMKRIYDKEFLKDANHRCVDIVQGSLLMVKSDIMINYGMYDEEVFLYCEEQILGQKLKEAGYLSILLLNENYIHNHSVSINKEYKTLLSKKKVYLKSKLLFLKKYQNISHIGYLFAKAFFILTLAEIVLISFLKRFTKK